MITFKKPEWIEAPGDVRLHAEVMPDAEDSTHGILPCPFCGSPYLTISNTHTAIFTVECDRCTAEIHGKYYGGDKPFKTRPVALRAYRSAFKSAIEAWNRRAGGVSVNINSHVLVRLTSRGKQALRKNGHYIPNEDSDGWSRWQLHSLMSAFGNHIGPCFGDVPFETTIHVERD